MADTFFGSTVLLLAAGLTGCAQFERARMEFDSVTGFDQVADEPELVQYRDEALRWPWGIRQVEGTGLDVFFAFVFGSAPRPVPIDNPSGFARERLQEMSELTAGELERIADVAHRLLWVAANDPQTLNQLAAVDCAAFLLESLSVDPVAVPFPVGDRRETIASFARGLSVLRSWRPGNRDAATWDRAARERYAATLAAMTETPSVQGADDRRLIRLLGSSLLTETDPELRRATVTALARAVGGGLAASLRRKLQARAPEVREAALLQLYRLSGPRAVAYSLRVMAVERSRVAAGGGRRSYDPSVQVRRTWIRLCGQLRGADALASWAGGPTPIEFLYDTLRFDPDDGLREIALEAMALSLDRPISFEREWADEWWRNHALSMTRGTP